MKTVLKAISLAAVILTASACSSHAPKEKWTDFRSVSVQQNVAAEDSNLVFFRGETGSAKTAVNIYINGEYQASLQQNGYTPV